MKLDVRIMAVRSRRQYVLSLIDRLGIGYDQVVFDNRGENGGGSAWYNAKRAWSLPMDGATHRIVIQDDVIVCDGFMDICRKIIEALPSAAFAFSGGAWIQPEMRKGNSPYLRLKGCCISAQAIILPAEHIQAMIAWSDEVFGPDYKHDDGRIGWYLCYHDVPTYSVIPSLVDHLQIDSVIPHHNRKDRYCRPWIGEQIGDQDWSDTEASISPYRLCSMWMNEKDPHFPAVRSMMETARKKARAVGC